MSLVQIVRRRVEVDKVKRGEQPMLELELDDNQRVVQIEEIYVRDFVSRSTVDYVFHVWVEARL